MADTKNSLDEDRKRKEDRNFVDEKILPQIKDSFIDENLDETKT